MALIGYHPIEMVCKAICDGDSIKHPPGPTGEKVREIS